MVYLVRACTKSRKGQDQIVIVCLGRNLPENQGKEKGIQGQTLKMEGRQIEVILKGVKFIVAFGCRYVMRGMDKSEGASSLRCLCVAIFRCDFSSYCTLPVTIKILHSFV